MWYQRGYVESKEGTNGLVAVAIDKDSKGSQNALKWTTDHLVAKGHNLILIHVRLKPHLIPSQPLSSSRVHHLPSNHEPEQDQHMKGLFLPFHCFCTRKDISCKDVILEDTDIVKALVEYVTQAAIENLVVGAASRSGFRRRFKMTDISSSVAKSAPDFCCVYVISKEKISFMRSASRPAPVISSVDNIIPNQTSVPEVTQPHAHNVVDIIRPENTLMEPVHGIQHDVASIKSPFTRGRAANNRSYGEITMPETDISFVNTDRPSTSSDCTFPSFYDTIDSSQIAPRISISDIPNLRFESPQFGRKSVESQFSPHNFFSEISEENDDTHSLSSSQDFEDVGMKMRRMKLEMKQTMDMYNTACKEAIMARQKATELESWKIEEEQKLEKARRAEEAALALAEKEKARSKAAFQHAEAAKKIAELESQKRILAEIKVMKESEAKQMALNALANSDIRYRKYSIEEIEIATDYFKQSHKIGEGSYGPVYKCFLDHTQVAVKILRPEAAQGRSQFKKEVEVLSCIRHPNMVLLLGACPEYGCLIYEYMANGSLDDRLFQRGNTPPLPWQLRFKIAAEISTGLLFLHQTKPEPLVHRDLKPGNILLDHNFTSKIGDVGLARLVPPSVADTATQYHMTSTAGTFCYIDPEYQQTGMLGIKSDMYSLGIMFLQLVTAKPPMGLTYHVQRAIEEGSLGGLLDPSVLDWPVEETLRFANVALKCAELRRKDRPDLGSVVLPQLEELRAFAESYMHRPDKQGLGGSHSPIHCKPSSSQDVFSSYSNGLPSECGSSGASSKTH